MKRGLLIFIFSMMASVVTYGNEAGAGVENNIAPDVVTQQVDTLSNTVGNRHDRATEATLNTTPTNKGGKARTFIIIGVVVGIVVYAVYRKKRKIARREALVDSVFEWSNRTFSTPSPRIIHHKELTLDYLLKKDAQECVVAGATTMNLFRFDSFVERMPEGRDLINGVDNIDENKIIVCVGVDNDNSRDVYVALHHSDALDEKLSAALNKKGVLAIVLRGKDAK